MKGKDSIKEEKIIQTNKSKKNKEKTPPKNSQEYMEQVTAKRIKSIKISIIIVAVIILLLACSTIFAFMSMTNSKIIKGITIEGIDVSGLNNDEAYKLIEEKVKKRQTATVKLDYPDYEKELPMEQLEVEANIQEAVDKATKKGREGNIFQNNLEVLKRKFKKENIEINIKYNEENLDKFLTDTSLELPGVVKESTYSIEEEELIITKGTDGIVLDKEKMENDIKDKITNLSKDFPDEMTIITKEEKAKEIDIEAIYNEVHTEPQNAYIVEEPFQVVVDKDGVDFAITLDEAKALLQEVKEEYIIPLKITKAEVTVANLGSRAFPDLLSTYTTRYDAGNINRSTNLSVACRKINNYVLQPGETFSYNQTLGKRTVENGFREAHIFTSTGVEDGMGGGICQISSTLYNSVLLANLEIVERHNHMYDAEYVDQGRDATVSYGSLDFKFKNPRKYPIKISASISGGVATISIYGIKEENEPQVKVSSSVTSTIPCPVQKIEDPSLPEGTEQVVTRGMNGYKSVAYRYRYYSDGRVEKELLSSDSYATITKVVKVGTKQSQQQVTPPPTTPTPTQITEPSQSPTQSAEPTDTPTPTETPINPTPTGE